jgi:hypothetical protein
VAFFLAFAVVVGEIVAKADEITVHPADGQYLVALPPLLFIHGFGGSTVTAGRPVAGLRLAFSNDTKLASTNPDDLSSTLEAVRL